MTKPFLPEGYEVPKTGGGAYMKLKVGPNKFRILSETTTGYEFWTKENKPVRVREYPTSVPDTIRSDSKIKHFWAFVVWNYAEGAVQILELTQTTLQGPILDLLNSEDWGDPRGYDLTVNRKGEDLETEYTVQPSPQKPLSTLAQKQWESVKVNLDALFTGGNPFEKADDADTVFEAVTGEALVVDPSKPWKK